MVRTKRIGDICDILNGFAFKSNEYVGNGIRVMRITNVQKGEVVDDEPKFFPLERESEISRYMLKNGDLLMSLTGNVGRVGLLTLDMLPAALNQRVACLRIKVPDVSMKYLFHILNSDNFEADCIYNASGIAQKNMSTKWLEDYTIPIPSLEEQEQIVAELDLLTGIIEKQKQQLKELDNLAQSIFYDMFGNPDTNEMGWEKRKMIDVGIGKLTYGSGSPSTQYNGEVRYIRITDIDDDGSLKDDVVSAVDSNEKYLLQDGDILFARTGATVGKTYRHYHSNGKCIYAGYLIRLIPNKSIVHPDYVFGFTKTQYYKSFVALAQKAVAQPNINAEQYGNLLICVPPMELQESYAKQIQIIESQKQSINRSIAESQKLFGYTMDKYFG